jgi:hypothetical protein
MNQWNGFVALSLLTLIAGCVWEAKQEDDLLVSAGFIKAKANTPELVASLKSLPPHRFSHRTVNGVPMVYYADPVACKCVYSGTAAAFANYKQAHAEDAGVYDQIEGPPP